MPVWRYSNKNVKNEEAENSLNSIKSACFHCGTHNNECPIASAAGEIKTMMEVKE
jgi:heterodisulfide reductase subunit C